MMLMLSRQLAADPAETSQRSARRALLAQLTGYVWPWALPESMYLTLQ